VTSAVVFAYHNVGARCLRVVLAHGIEVPLVVTQLDDPRERLWFERVADVATKYGVEWIAPDDANAPDVVAKIAALKPDFLFSFYYRRMLGPALLAVPSRGALNMHGSLLPKYRGRAPVNWAVLHGETETGATLHYMTAKPDAGDIVAQERVPILPDETAKDVFDKVTVAAETALDRVLPALIAGTAPRQVNDVDGRRIEIAKTRMLDTCPPGAPQGSGLFAIAEAVFARCGDGRCLAIVDARCGDRPLSAGLLGTFSAAAR